MRLLGKSKLRRLKRKNRGNKPLAEAVDKLIEDIENGNWTTQEELKADRRDADCVHSDGFYFLDVSIHRTLSLVEFSEPTEEGEEGTVQVLWTGSHDDYERVFKNNKPTIEKWLKNRGHI